MLQEDLSPSPDASPMPALPVVAPVAVLIVPLSTPVLGWMVP